MAPINHKRLPLRVERVSMIAASCNEVLRLSRLNNRSVSMDTEHGEVARRRPDASLAQSAFGAVLWRSQRIEPMMRSTDTLFGTSPCTTAAACHVRYQRVACSMSGAASARG